MEVFIGSIQMFGFNFAPRYWAQCGGQLLSLSQYQTLFALLGTTYGGNGQSNFGLPNLQGRLPIGQGTGPGLTPRVMGEDGGNESVSILGSNLPNVAIPTTGLTLKTTVNLAATPSNASPTPSASHSFIGASPTAGPSEAAIYSDAQGTSPVALQGVTSTFTGTLALPGSNIPLGTMNPFLAVNFCIALQGIFPTRN
ncbi:phage tail protein [Pseudomonas batumici]|uniref:Microcystin dependent protein n=1 Tax=Pseudomonas batumici TaxID=226910 RepID=A0A0C2I6G3_9PSED|nr:tail fiber protein [Pseudomonas batumici]KIH80692.1 Microcystin dependent protein [Pseudomonas batumici]